MQYDISVIIPTFNVESYIEDCLESIVNQTFRGTLECIIVDDCCTDRTIKIVKSILNKYNGPFLFKLLHQDKNQGQASARNRGIEEANGTFIYFIDSDDFITKNCLQLLFDIAKKNDRIDLVQGGMDTIWGETTCSNKDFPDIVDNIKWIKKAFHLPGGLLPGPCNRLIKREILIKNKVLFPEGIIYEDVPFTFQLAQHLSCIAFCKEQTYIYRTRRPGSTVTAYNDERSLDSRIVVINKMIDLVDNVYFHIQLRSIMQKLILYFKIHKTENLVKHDMDFKKIYKRIQTLMPWYYKIPSFVYFTLPLNIKRKTITYKLFKHIF